ncbi:MAG: hypothetical protein HY812_19665 [Planctomycetes bacterium]|nr:hypothetical protein [Planctomycetota bacterium]
MYGDARVEAQQAVPGLVTILKEIEGVHAKLHSSAGEIKQVLAGRGTAGSKDAERASQVMTLYAQATRPALEDMQVLLGRARDAVRGVADEANAETLSTASLTQALVGALALVAMLLGVGMAWFVARGIARRLKETALALRQGAAQVNCASAEVAASSQSLAAGASEQAASLEEASASVNEVSAMVKQTAENAAQVNERAKHNAVSAREAKGKADLVHGDVVVGQEAVEKLGAAMKEIKSSSEKTSRIIKTIDEIAFQTNLLALNAAVEAARAGEAGKGFAVVASEVRSLAQRSGAAATETADLIEESVKNADHGFAVGETVQQALGKIGEGVTTVMNLIDQMAAASDEQSALVEAITRATHEQSEGMQGLFTAVSEVDKVTQANAACAEESAAAAAELKSQSGSLGHVVEELEALVVVDRERREQQGAAARTESVWTAPAESSLAREAPPEQPRMRAPRDRAEESPQPVGAAVGEDGFADF